MFSLCPAHIANILRFIGCLTPPPLSIGSSLCQFNQPRHLRARSLKMAAFTVARSSCGLIHGLRVSFGCLTLPKHGAIAAAVPQTNLLRQCRRYSISHMSVKERIDKKRKAALVGGGQNRIDAQHKKVIPAEHQKSMHLLLEILFKLCFLQMGYVQQLAKGLQWNLISVTSFSRLRLP